MNHRKTFQIISAVCLLLLGGSKIGAQITSAQIDKLVEESMSKMNVAGAAVAVVKDGKVIHSKGYGVKSIKTKEKVDASTCFAIASNSKAFTTTALAILVEEGKLNWTDKVIDHIPEFRMYDPYVTANFNIQDLLTHRSGLGLGVGDLMFFPDGSDFTIDHLLGVFQHFKPVSAFRTKYDYDNLLYVVAGEVVKRASGMSWEQFVQEKIMSPLQMDKSFPALPEVNNQSGISYPHNTIDGKLMALPHFKEMINGAAGGIYANVEDLSKWILCHLNKGKYGPGLDKQLFSEESQREMWKIHTVLEPNRNPRYKTHFAGYGLGWGLSDVLGNMVVTHTGGLPGMLSKTLLVPDLNLGFVILTNTEPGGGALFSAISQTILDSYHGLSDYGWVDIYNRRLNEGQNLGDSVVTEVWNKVKMNAGQKINLTNYTATYRDAWFGDVEVFNKNDKLYIKCVRSPKLNGQLQFYNANTFAVKWEYQDMNADAFVMFDLDENGLGKSIKMKGISPNIDFSFDFHDLDLIRVNVGE